MFLNLSIYDIKLLWQKKYKTSLKILLFVLFIITSKRLTKLLLLLNLANNWLKKLFYHILLVIGETKYVF